ncbi:MAG: ATPase, T2SS/T4P/T4SS family, partial [Planctomycetota bacterium]
MSTFNKKLRQILLKDGRIPATEVEKALHASTEDKVSLSRFLVSTGKIAEKDLVGLLSREIGFPPIDLDRVQPDPEVLSIVTEEMALEHGIFPLSKIGNFLTVAVADPFDVLKLDHVRIVTRCEIRPVVTSEAQLKAAIKKAYSGGDKEVADLIEGFNESEVELEEDRKVEATLDLNDLQTAGNASPVVKLVNLIVFQAIRERVSDIHIEPYEQKVRVRYRLDGILRDTVSPPKNLQNALVSRIKIMAGLDIAERRKPQDGKFQVKAEGRHIDFRVSVLPVVHGEKVVMRVLDGANLSLRL